MFVGMTAVDRPPVGGRRPPSHLRAQHEGRRAAPSQSGSNERAARLRAARRRGHRRLVALLATCIVVIVLALTLTGSSGPGTHKPGTPALGAPHPTVLATPTLRSSLTRAIVLPGKLSSLPFPSTGESAIVVSGLGLVAATGHERSVPVASVTKIMTAYLILKDHPLVGSSGGPVFTMTAADHAAWIQASEEDESNIEVKAGERLDERQLLEALMIPSADNIAAYLAAWDAGSVPAFVRKMNETAAALGLVGMHFADASGVNPGSRGTAVDFARLAALAMENPVLRSITDKPFIRLPVEGEIWNNYDPAVGVDGIIGVKSGFTEAAQTNLVSAAWRTIDHRRLLVVCDVIDQPNTLSGDAEDNEALLNAVTGDLRPAKLYRGGAQVGMASTAWNGDTSALRLPGSLVVIGWPGLVLHPEMLAAAPAISTEKHGWPAGYTVGTFEISYPYGSAVSEPMVLNSSIRPPPTGWSPSSGAG